MEIHIGSEFIQLFWQVTFVACFGIQMAVLLGVQLSLAFYKEGAPSANQPPVSVIIAARNEEENLLKNLPGILEQDYLTFEVIVVNDRSLDESSLVLKALSEKHPHLRIVNIHETDDYDGGKKYAITLGVKGAKHERLIFTDADCRPLSRKWIQSVVSNTVSDDNIILGYSPYERKAGLLNKLIRFDTFHTGLNYLSFALTGFPYMGVGRNLSYSKSAFFAAGGFKAHYRLRSGDDDLFVNQVATKKNTRICVSPDSLVASEPKLAWKDYWLQKRRHLTTGFEYKRSHKLALLLQPVTLILFWVSAIVLLLSGVWEIAVISLILLRVLVQMLIFKKSSRLLGESDVILFAPLLEIVNIVITTCSHAANAVTNQVTWKN